MVAHLPNGRNDVGFDREEDQRERTRDLPRPPVHRRHPRRRPRDSETIARKFKALVEAAGERRPEGYPKRCRGLALAPAEPEPKPPALTFGAVVEEKYLAAPSCAGKRQLADYRNLFDRHVRPAIVTLEDGTHVGPLGGLPIIDVTTDVIEAWVTWMGGQKYKHRGEMVSYAPKTFHNVYGGELKLFRGRLRG